MKIKYSELKKLGFDKFEDTVSDEITEPKIKPPAFDALDFDTDLTYGNGLCILPDYCKAKLIKAGKYRKIVVSSNNSTGKALKKIRLLSNNRYKNTETGEVKQRKKREYRTESMACLNNSIKEVRLLIYTNFVDVEGYFITLAYDSYMPDYKKAQKDFNQFMDKLKYRCEKRYGIKLAFLKVIEPKTSGSWHFHLLIKSATNKRLNISEDFVRRIWGQNSVKVEPITDGEGLAAYLGKGTCTYTDTDNFNISMLDDKCSYLRRSFYKRGMRLYSTSQNLQKPIEVYMTQDEAHAAVADCTKIGENHTLVKKKKADREYILNAINYETYKKED